MKQVLSNYWKLVVDNSRWVRLAAWSLTAGIVMGVVMMTIDSQGVIDALSLVLDQFVELSEEADSSGFIERAWLLFENNMIAVSIIIFGGMFLGILAWQAIFFNGFFIGFIAYVTVVLDHNPIGLLSIIPHAVFELPALIIAAAFGMKLGLAWLLPSAQGKRKQVLNNSALECVRVLGLMLMLLLVAAIVEAGISWGFSDWISDF